MALKHFIIPSGYKIHCKIIIHNTKYSNSCCNYCANEHLLVSSEKNPKNAIRYILFFHDLNLIFIYKLWFGF